MLTDLGPLQFVETVLDLAVVPLAVFAVAGTELPGVPIGSAVQGLFFLSLIYILIPEFFPSRVGGWPSEPGARWILALTVFAALVTMQRSLGVPPLLGILPVASALLFGYFQFTYDAPVFSLDGPLFRTGQLLFDHEESDEGVLTEFREARRPVRLSYGPLLCVAVAFYLVFVGLLFYVVSFFSPMLEVGTVLLTAHGVLGARLER